MCAVNVTQLRKIFNSHTHKSNIMRGKTSFIMQTLKKTKEN